MTDFPSDPDWSLLPHAPARFFGLSEGFDRRDLKRCYNQLIRRFKPERFPQEFQRIRAAYEQLEEALRYGQSIEADESSVDAPQWLAQAAAQPSAASAAPTRGVPLHEQIKTGSVSQLYRELQDRVEKSPFDFYALAVLSDVVDRQNDRQFVEWLLKGLAAYPGEVGLSRLLYAYFRAPIDGERCAALLVRCSKIVPEDGFFPLTEPLWRTLLRSQEFRHFRETLTQCEANLKGINIDNRLAFYMQILKPAMWVADSEWTDGAYGFIEQNFDRIPRHLDYDLEILARLRAYIQVREQFVRSNDLRARVDQSIRDYFSEEQFKGDQSVLAAQVLLARDVDGLTAAFAEFGNEVYAKFYAVWIWVSYDVAERHVEPPKERLNDRTWYPRTERLLLQIEQRTTMSLAGLGWLGTRVAYYLAMVLTVVVGLIGTSLLGRKGVALYADWRGNSDGLDAVKVIAGLWGAGLGVYLGYRLDKYLSRRYWQSFMPWFSLRFYRKIWRRELISFLATSHLSYETLRGYVQTLRTDTEYVQWIKHYMGQDYALPLFAVAQCFVV